MCVVLLIVIKDSLKEVILVPMKKPIIIKRSKKSVKKERPRKLAENRKKIRTI